METIGSHNELQELLSSVDGWNLYDDALIEFKECNVDVRDFYCIGGEGKDSDGTKLFKTLIVDRENNDIYRTSFNSEWCPEDQKEWLWSVTTRQQVESIQQAKRMQKARTRQAWGKLCDTFK